MGKPKPVAKKPKAATLKKVTANNNKSSAKPLKLGGVPNQGSV